MGLDGIIFIDYWTCDACESGHYGMCHKCGKCGRKFDSGFLLNGEEFPSSGEDD